MDPNPYASPQVPSEPQSPGIGAWRDGNYLVMHYEAELPRYCITSGEVADGARELVLSWRTPGDLLSRTHQFWLPQVRPYLVQYAREKRLAKIGMGLMALMLLLVIVGMRIVYLIAPANQLDAILSLLAITAIPLSIAVIIVWLWWLLNSKPPLRHVHSWRDYVWFEGAHPRFLARLAPWPGSAR